MRVARELRTISVVKLEPLETAQVNEARLRSIGCVVRLSYGVAETVPRRKASFPGNDASTH